MCIDRQFPAQKIYSLDQDLTAVQLKLREKEKKDCLTLNNNLPE